MRELTPEECEFISGGLQVRMLSSSEDPAIVVTGSPPPYFPPYIPPSPPPYIPSPSPGYGGGGGSGSGTGSYSTPGASSAANNFANAHVKNQGTAAGDAATFQQTHDDVAKLWDHYNAYPSDIINIGNGVIMSLSKAMDDLSKVTFVITDSAALAGSSGARTVPTPTAGGPLTIYLNPTDPGSVQYHSSAYGSDANGPAGTNYEVMHEFGHALNYYENNGKFTDEAAANTAGRSLENEAGLALMHNSAGVLITPTNGYD